MLDKNPVPLILLSPTFKNLISLANDVFVLGIIILLSNVILNLPLLSFSILNASNINEAICLTFIFGLEVLHSIHVASSTM